MSLITPQLKLLLQQTPGESDEYILESTSTFVQSNFVANGHDSLPISLDENDEFKINLLVGESTSIPGNSTPAVVDHVVYLGDLDFNVEDFVIRVFVLNQKSEVKGEGHVRNADAVIITKPIKMKVKSVFEK